jgi:hypothetical protein
MLLKKDVLLVQPEHILFKKMQPLAINVSKEHILYQVLQHAFYARKDHILIKKAHQFAYLAQLVLMQIQWVVVAVVAV